MAVLLCFVLDLPTLNREAMRNVKTCLLQLSHHYKVIGGVNSFSQNFVNSKPADCFGVCYVERNDGLVELKIAYSPHEYFNLSDFHDALDKLPDNSFCAGTNDACLKIAYSPHEYFNLSDFHDALDKLPDNSFCAETNDAGTLYLKLVEVLSQEILYSWGPQDNNVARKVIVMSSILNGTLDHVTLTALQEANNNHVTVEFILLTRSSSLIDVTGDNQFPTQIDALGNCSFWTCPLGLHGLYGLSRRWLLDIIGERLTRFIFKANLPTQNKISYNFCKSSNTIVEELVPCETCRCHGIALDNSGACPVTNRRLGPVDRIPNCVRIGEQTVLHMPSFPGRQKLKQDSSPIHFNVMQITNFGSLNEGLIIGETYVVTPAFSDDYDKSAFIQVVRSVLRYLSLDRGFASSTCNNGNPLYNIILPSDKGYILLKRLSMSPLPSLAGGPIVDDSAARMPVPSNFDGSLDLSINYSPPASPPWKFKKTKFLQLMILLAWALFAVAGLYAGEIIARNHSMDYKCNECPCPCLTPSGPAHIEKWLLIAWRAGGFFVGLVMYIPLLGLIAIGCTIRYLMRLSHPFVKYFVGRILVVGGMALGQFLTAKICLMGYDKRFEVFMCCMLMAYVSMFLTGGLRITNDLGFIGGFVGVCMPFLVRSGDDPRWLGLVPIPLILFCWPVVERACLVDDADMCENIGKAIFSARTRASITTKWARFFHMFGEFFQAIVEVDGQN